MSASRPDNKTGQGPQLSMCQTTGITLNFKLDSTDFTSYIRTFLSNERETNLEGSSRDIKYQRAKKLSSSRKKNQAVNFGPKLCEKVSGFFRKKNSKCCCLPA
jgi:hypothetical protein